jgi:hypothetical protein
LRLVGVAALVELDSAVQHYVVLDEVAIPIAGMLTPSVVSDRFAIRSGVFVPSRYVRSVCCAQSSIQPPSRHIFHVH